MSKLVSKILTRSDTSANWSKNNPVLGKGECGYATDLRRTKHGDGTTKWNNLKWDDAATVNGHAVNSDVPAGAKFTDTTYTAATTSSAGLMSASDKSKLDGIGAGSNVKSVNGKTGAVTLAKGDVGLGSVVNYDQSKAIKSITRSGTTFTATALDGTTSTFTQQDTNTTYGLASQSSNGLMSAADKKAIDREFFRMVPKGGTYIPANADLNSIEYIKVGNYYNTFDRESTTIKNIPVIQLPYKAFMMYVLSPLTEVYDNESIDQWVYRLRIFVTYTGNDIFVQQVDSGATAGKFNYGPWVKMTNSNDLGAVSKIINDHIANKSNPHSVTKAQVGLGSVANLDQSKAIKSITRSGTTFTATALDGTTTTFTQQDSSTTYSVATSSADGLMSAADKSKLDGIGAGSNVKSVNGKTGVVSLSKADIGLDNVDNTSDADKPYYKLIGQTETNTNKVGHFNFNDASQSLYKIKNFYAASGEGDYFYLAHKKLDYTITATKHFSNIDDLFTADLSSDCSIATDLISESDPAILTIVRKNEFEAARDLTLTLIFYEYMGQQSNARLKHWKLETMIFTGQDWEWLTVFERTNVSDSINCLWCGLNSKQNWAYLRIKGIRITIYAATPYHTMSYEFGYNQLRIAGMRLLESRPLFSPAEALGALDVAGGTVYGETEFQEGISATSYSGATATSSADGLMSKADKAKLDTLANTLEGSYRDTYKRINALANDLAALQNTIANNYYAKIPEHLPSGFNSIDRASMNYLKNGWYWHFSGDGALNFPSDWGFMIKFGFEYDGDFSALYFTQMSGTIYRCSGNANGISGWVAI